MKSTPFTAPVVTANFNLSSVWRLWFADAAKILFGVQYHYAAQYVAPVTGFSIQALPATSKLILTPAAGLATGAVLLPTNPYEGMEWRLSSTQAITALTLTPPSGVTVMNAPAGLAAGIGIAFTYSAVNATWYRLY
jgi:hypothetical protein